MRVLAMGRGDVLPDLARCRVQTAAVYPGEAGDSWNSSLRKGGGCMRDTLRSYGANITRCQHSAKCWTLRAADQPRISKTAIPATVVRMVIGMPNRA